MPNRNNHVVFVTGMSGAGKSIALKALEDLGFEAMDNVPLSIIETITNPELNKPNFTAIGIDIRNRDFSTERFISVIEMLRVNDSLAVSLLFMDCGNETLQRRFTETRRKHPINNNPLITESIESERKLMEPIRNIADFVIDSTDLSSNDLKRYIKGNFFIGKRPPLHIVITSFSYKKGLPKEADLVLDVRFLRNPYYENELASLNGTNLKVKEYIEQDPAFLNFFTQVTPMLLSLLPLYYQEGKSYLTIAFGCTGGQHRSVFVAEKIFRSLKETAYDIELIHRDIPRPSAI